jgi:type II pantothenate kinase
MGVDVGATLAKIATRQGDAPPRFDLAPAGDLARVAGLVAAHAPSCLGLTGGGAAALARLLEKDTVRVNEFAAWGCGASSLLRANGHPTGDRHLIVSLGTGTSVMLVDGLAVTRVGGTALGGGTLVGLGGLLLGEPRFEPLIALAAKGDRRRVDLLVSDIYRGGELGLGEDLTASNFGKLGRAGETSSGPRVDAADLAHALVGLVGENVALVCGGLAAALGVRRIVYAGSTLRGNLALTGVLRDITAALGHEPLVLADGEFAGALGALLVAASR